MFEAFSQPHYTVTVEVDVTDLKAKTKARGFSFYAAFAWVCTRAFGQTEAFRYRQRPDGTIVVVDRLDTLLAVMNDGDVAFRQVFLPLTADSAAYEKAYREKVADRTAPPLVDLVPGTPVAFYSALPWFSFTGLENAQTGQMHDNDPLVALGKYTVRDGRLMMPLAVQVNHHFVQGNDMGAFFAALDREMAAY